MLKELKEGMMTMFHQMENNNKEMEIFYRNKLEILELKSIKPKIKNSLQMHQGRSELAEKEFVNLKIDKVHH